VEPGAGASSVRLGGKYEIQGARPLEIMRSPSAAAYTAVNVERSADQLFGLVCNPQHAPREAVVEGLHALNIDAIVVPMAWGVVDWAGRRNFAVVLERPGGARIATAQTDVVAPMSEDEVIHNVIPPLISGLRTLFNAGLTHRSIRPTNLFRHANGRHVVLGECVSAPPGLLQPMSCEPIEGGMALPAGRGDGSSADDIYALGATLIYLVLGRDPTAEMPAEQILLDKINRGSYQTLLGANRLPARLIEPIRGMLADDPRERWTLQDLDLWHQGRRIPPKQFAFAKRAARPLDFGGQGYLTARSLAHAFARDPTAAARMIKSPDFDIWLQRSLSDPERNANVASAMTEVTDANGAGDGRLVARVCVALDPPAPLRLNDFAAAPDGVGSLLAAALIGKAPLQPLGQALAARLPQFWFAAQTSLRPEQAIVLKSFERVRFFLEDRRPGFGLERVLYELNPRLHCLSPLVERDYVVDPGDLLRVLENAVANRRIEGDAVDRHIAAFIAVHFRLAGNDWHDALASSEPIKRALGMLQMLSRLQNLRGPAAVPALSERLAAMLPPLIDRLHNRQARARLKAALQKVAAKGDLGALLNLVDNGTDQRGDAQGFQAAQQEYAAIEHALGVLKHDAPARPAHAATVGGRVSVTLANTLAWVAAITAAVLGS
jgi:hypothetical protein